VVVVWVVTTVRTSVVVVTLGARYTPGAVSVALAAEASLPTAAGFTGSPAGCAGASVFAIGGDDCCKLALLPALGRATGDVGALPPMGPVRVDGAVRD
jgi:hypothetical protein